MYILRPPLSTERLLLPGPDGLVHVALKKPFSDGTVAVDLDPLSLLCRLVALVPAPRFHTVRYSGVLAAASKWRPLIVPKPAPTGATDPASTSEQQSCGLPPEPPCQVRDVPIQSVFFQGSRMKLASAQVQNFRSVEDSRVFTLDHAITCLVGKNESGKPAC